MARLAGTGITSSNDFGIWAEDPSGELMLIARTGDLLDIDDGPGTDFRTINDLFFTEFSGNEDGRPSGFNELGQLAFRASFSGGTDGIFVSNLAASVPEPSDLKLVIEALVDDGVLNRGQGNSLLVKLNFNSNQQAAPNRIEALINQINAFVNAGILTSVEGELLIDGAESLRDNLSVAGDFDADGNLDGADFLKWQRNDGSTAGLALWEMSFGTVAAPATIRTVPEPSTGMVLFIGMMVLLFRRGVVVL